jgi:hypothetical protein
MDIQTLLPKSTDVARAKHVEGKRSETFQQQFVVEANRKNVKKQQTVGASTIVRRLRIDRDGGSGGRERRPGHDHPAKKTAQNGSGARQVQGDGAQAGRPDGTGRLVNVMLGDDWGRT